MTVEAVLDIASEALWTIIITSAPLILLSLIVGLIISIFQAVTSIQEQTLTFVPKLLAIFIGLMVFGSFIMNTIVTFMQNLWTSFGEYI
ncbi:MAG: flagellar biosynthesis protein FliQ [Lachnospiraceae bacterium]|nr:flagellar biosynthesis protein FliQ [Lachnospiraceae bacterium]